MKKILAFTLVLAMLVSVLAACGSDTSSSTTESSKATSTTESTGSGETSTPAASGDELAFKKFENPVDVHIGMNVNPTDTTLPAGDTAEDNQYTRYLRDNYNINVIVDWTAAEGNDYNQKVSLAIASDSLPDGLVAKDQTYMKKAAESGMLYDISDLFQQYASTQVKGIMESTEGRAVDNASYEGKMVALPNVTVLTDGVHVLNVRKDWLDEYDLEIPKTLDDVENVARVFLDKKPAGDATVAIAGPDKNTFPYCTFLKSSNNANGFDPVFGAYDAYPGYWLENEAGEVTYGTIEDNTRTALERLASWYKDGLIDPEMGTRDQTGDIINANQAGMRFGPWWALGYGNNDSFVNDPTANWQAYPIFDDQGKWNVHMKTTGTEYGMISVNASEDVAAAIIIMYNALVRDEATFDTTVAIGWYPLRVVAAAADEVEHETIELTKILDGKAEPEDYNDPTSIYKLMYSDAQKIRTVIPGYEAGRDLNVEDFSMDNRGDFNRTYSLMIGNRPYATTAVDKEVYSLTYSMTPTMEQKWSNLQTMEDETILKIITGKSDISAFDQFKTDWLAQGGQEIIDEVAALK